MITFLHDPNQMYRRGHTLGDLHVYFDYCQHSYIRPSADIRCASPANINQYIDITSP